MKLRGHRCTQVLGGFLAEVARDVCPQRRAGDGDLPPSMAYSGDDPDGFGVIQDNELEDLQPKVLVEEADEPDDYRRG